MTPQENKLFVQGIKKIIMSANAVIASQKDITVLRTSVLKSKVDKLEQAIYDLTNLKK